MGVKLYFSPTKARWTITNTRTGQKWYCYDSNCFGGFEAIQTALNSWEVWGCPFQVSAGKPRRNFPRMLKRMEEDSLYNASISRVVGWVENLAPGCTFHAKEPDDQLEFYLKGNRELMRDILDWCICLGYLEKIRFKCSEEGGGHLYKRVENKPPCEYLDDHRCKFKDWMVLTSKEDEEGVSE